MLAEKYFPKKSPRYNSISKLFKNLDWINTLKIERWFGLWIMVLAGSNVSIHQVDRWSYWDWSTFNFLILGILVLITILISIKPNFLQRINSFSSGINMFFKGFMLFTCGTIPFGFDFNTFVLGIPYFIYFIVAHLTWSIVPDNDDKTIPLKKDTASILTSISLLTLICSLLGYLNDDPVISTIAAIYILFPVVILFFPPAIRHIQRARMHVIFIPAMFISISFPWFLFLVLPLFWILRYYNYFKYGEVKPSFKVDLPTDMNH